MFGLNRSVEQDDEFLKADTESLNHQRSSKNTQVYGQAGSGMI